MATIESFIEFLSRSVAAVGVDIVAAEAGKAALETRISLLKRERQRLEAELARELATAAGKQPQSSSTQNILLPAAQSPAVAPASSASASASGPVPHHTAGVFAEPRPREAGKAAPSVAGGGKGGRKRKRQNAATPEGCEVCEV